MPLNLADWVARWEIRQVEITLVMPGTQQVLEARPQRLAVGFSHAGTTNIAVFPLVQQENRCRFFLLGNSNQWFYWEKHAAMVALPWFFETANLAGDTVTAIEIYQSGAGS